MKTCAFCFGKIEGSVGDGVDKHYNVGECLTALRGEVVEMRQEINKLREDNDKAHKSLRNMANAAAYGV